MVHDQVGNKLEFDVDDLSKNLKNINRPIRVYRMRPAPAR